jgi:hypothetical protein
VWDSNAWFEFLVRARQYLGHAFEIRVCQYTGTEIVCVLRKTSAHEDRIAEHERARARTDARVVRVATR